MLTIVLAGLYEQQDTHQQDLNLRGQFVTDDEGRYSFYCLRPTPYPVRITPPFSQNKTLKQTTSNNITQVPSDGPAGQLLQLMDRHPFRPAHIHLVVRHAKYKHLTTQIFDKDCKYLADDSVFAVKDELSVRFAPRKGDALAGLELEYDISLAPIS